MRLIFTLFLVLFLSGAVVGQSEFTDREVVIEAFKESNTTKIKSYLGKYITLHIDDETGVYTAQQTITILQDFFKKQPPESIVFVKEGESNLNYFCIAKYLSKGTNWRVYILFYRSENKYIIKQIDIEKGDK